MNRSDKELFSAVVAPPNLELFSSSESVDATGLDISLKFP